MHIITDFRKAVRKCDISKVISACFREQKEMYTIFKELERYPNALRNIQKAGEISESLQRYQKDWQDTRKVAEILKKVAAELKLIEHSSRIPCYLNKISFTQ